MFVEAEREATTYELVERDLRALRVEEEPPGIAEDGRATDVRADDHVAEEQPGTDERFATVAGRDAHDGVVGRVEAEGGGGETVGDEVDPKQLHGDERLGHAEKDGQEDADDLSNVRRNYQTSQQLVIGYDGGYSLR